MADPFQPTQAPDATRSVILLEDTETAQDFTRVAAITGALILVTRAIPHPAARVFAFLVSGAAFDPVTGKAGVGKNTALNFAPAPFGFAHPKTYNLTPNFYLPGGSSKYIPGPVDSLGIGTREQRAADTSKAVQQREIFQKGIAMQLQRESNDTINQLATGTGGPFTRASELRAFPGGASADLQAAAQAEVERRNAGGTQVPPKPTVPRTSLFDHITSVDHFTFRATQGFLTANAPNLVPAPTPAPLPFATFDQGTAGTAPAEYGGDPPAMGSTVPENVKPVNDAAIRNNDGKKGIDRQFVQERADP